MYEACGGIGGRGGRKRGEGREEGGSGGGEMIDRESQAERNNTPTVKHFVGSFRATM